MNPRSRALAERIEQGAAALAAFAVGLSDQEWNTVIPGDGRTVGVIVHHVANMYPIEVELAQVLASGKPIEGVTWAAVADINKKHAHEHARCTKAEALEFLRRNSRAAADAVRGMKDEDLDHAAPISLNADAPLTAQFFIEDHALRHSFHHLAKMKAALKR
jgi:DinB superfamily